MSRITQLFQKLKEKKEYAFIPFLVISDPTPEIFIDLVKIIEPYADIIELGIPYSDPLADGPVIQVANQRAMKMGITIDSSYDFIRKIRSFTDKPIVILTYANVLGPPPQRKKTLSKLHEAGMDGIIVADLPMEEYDEITIETRELGIDYIYLVTPLTNNIRLEQIINKVSGFLYIVSVRGVTGARETILDETKETIIRVRKFINKKQELPLCVGFGISKPNHIKELIQIGADGAIIGSALIKHIEKNLDNVETMKKEILNFVKSMKDATRVK